MALRPGINTSIRENEVIEPAPTDTGPAFNIGMFQKGPVGSMVTLTNDTDAETTLGGIVAYSTARDAITGEFQDGAGTINVSRFVGPAAVNASVALLTSAPSTTGTFVAKNPGTYANGYQVVVTTAGGSAVTVVVKDAAGNTLDSSPVLADEPALIAWMATISSGTYTNAAGVVGLPAPATYTLASGAGDEASVTNTQIGAALDVFTYDKGPGQVLAPGYTSSAVIALLAAHAATHNRYALADAPASSVADLETFAGTVRTAVGDNARFLSMVTPSVVARPLTGGASRTLPGSAVMAGLIAKSDRVNSIGAPVANLNGQSYVATDVTVHYTPAEITRLVKAGYTVLINRRGTVIAYSDRTVADVASDANWYEMSDARTIMAIRAQGEAFLETVEFAQIDSKGRLKARVVSGFRNILAPMYDADDLFGETFDDSFSISVTTDSANRTLSVDLAVTLSQSAEQIDFTITKRQIEEVG